MRPKLRPAEVRTLHRHRQVIALDANDRAEPPPRIAGAPKLLGRVLAGTISNADYIANLGDETRALRRPLWATEEAPDRTTQPAPKTLTPPHSTLPKIGNGPRAGLTAGRADERLSHDYLPCDVPTPHV